MAIYLNVSVPQVYAMVCSGELPAIKVGGRGVWRVDGLKLERYLNKLGPTPEHGPRLIL